MAKYIGWYLVWRFGVAALFFNVSPRVFEAVFNSPVAYSYSVALLLNFASVVMAAFITGYFFDEKYKRLPIMVEARILTGTLVLLAFIFFATEQLLLVWLYADTAAVPASRTAVEDLFGEPKVFTIGFYIFYAFYLLFHYWLIGWLFTKGAAYFLRLLKKEK